MHYHKNFNFSIGWLPFRKPLLSVVCLKKNAPGLTLQICFSPFKHDMLHVKGVHSAKSKLCFSRRCSFCIKLCWAAKLNWHHVWKFDITDSSAPSLMSEFWFWSSFGTEWYKLNQLMDGKVYHAAKAGSKNVIKHVIKIALALIEPVSWNIWDSLAHLCSCSP